MADFPQDAFTLWFNCNKDQKTEGAYWASSEVPVDELRKLFAWIKDAPKTENDKGQECVQLRAGLRPRTSKAGNERWNQLSSACQRMVNGFGKSPVTE